MKILIISTITSLIVSIRARNSQDFEYRLENSMAIITPITAMPMYDDCCHDELGTLELNE